MQLYEKYRPKTLQEFIGQPKITGALERITSRADWDRDAFWIQGPSGTGKTSLAWIVAGSVANDFDIAELDGDKCSVQAVREIERSIGLCPMFGGWKAYIINEAHAMSKQAVQAWLTLLEKLPAKRLIVFTTTEPLQENLFGNFSGPFARRCKVFTFTNQSLAKDFATRAREIALSIPLFLNSRNWRFTHLAVFSLLALRPADEGRKGENCGHTQRDSGLLENRGHDHGYTQSANQGSAPAPAVNS